MKKIFRAIILTAVFLFAFSCIHETALEGVNNSADMESAEVMLRLKTPSGFSQSQTKSLTYADENTINDIYVLAFNNSNMLVAIRQGTNITSSEGHSNPSYSGEGSFSVTLTASKTESDTYKLVVLANAQTILGSTVGFDVMAVTDKAYASVISKIHTAITGPMYPSGGTIPMWGESEQLVIKAGNNNKTLELTRSVARIDVGLGTASKNSVTDAWSWNGKESDGVTAIPFVLDHVYVIRANNRYSVAPDGARPSGKPTIPAGTEKFTVVNSRNLFGFEATTSATGGHSSRDIYIPEADVVMGGSIGDLDHTNRMALVVGGRYNSSTTETFYRIDFATGGNLMNVLRNHLYQFNISKVLGPGYPDVETAYNSLPMNITADILEWNETEIGDITFDGQYLLSVRPTSEFDFSRLQSTQTASIKTTYPSGWQVLKITEENGTPNSGWLTTDKNTGQLYGSNGEFTSMGITVKTNTELKDRTGYIYIKAGKLEAKITVTQSAGELLFLNVTMNSIPVSEILFNNDDLGPKTLKVDWSPKDADLSVTVSDVSGKTLFSGTNVPTNATISNANGTKSYAIRSTATTDPFQEKISKVDFVVYANGNYATESVFLRHFKYNTVGETEKYYMLDGSEHSFNIKSNTEWVISDVKDPDGILIGGASSLKNKSGGYNTAGEPIYFKLVNDAGKSGSIVTLTITDPKERTGEVTVYLRSFICGTNGNPVTKLIGSNNYLTHMYGVGTANAACWMVQNSREGGTYASATRYDNNAAFARGFYYNWPNRAHACPTGWRLPTTPETQALVVDINADKTADHAKWWVQPSLAFAGYHDYTTVAGGYWTGWETNGRWWTETTAYYFRANASNFWYTTGSDPDYDREPHMWQNWKSVRCVEITP